MRDGEPGDGLADGGSVIEGVAELVDEEKTLSVAVFVGVKDGVTEIVGVAVLVLIMFIRLFRRSDTKTLPFTSTATPEGDSK